MKTKLILTGTLLLLVAAGCVSLPPLVKVEHKETQNAANNDATAKRLDAIDQRLGQLEQKSK